MSVWVVLTCKPLKKRETSGSHGETIQPEIRYVVFNMECLSEKCLMWPWDCKASGNLHFENKIFESLKILAGRGKIIYVPKVLSKSPKLKLEIPYIHPC